MAATGEQVCAAGCDGRAPWRLRQINPTGKNSLFQKGKSPLRLSPSCPQARGVGHRYRTLGWDCGGRGGIVRGMGLQGGINSVSGPGTCGRAVPRRTVKSCGPDASKPASSQWKASRPDRARMSQLPADDGVKKPDRRGEHEIIRQAIAQGMSDVLRCPVCSCAPFLHDFAHETAGAARIRHSLLPHLRGTTTGKPRVTPAARRRTCIC